MSDLRSPIAKARDKWLESEQGQKCSQVGTLSSNPTYLINRLEAAFVAGYNAATDGFALAKMVLELLSIGGDGWTRRASTVEMNSLVAAARALVEKAEKQ